MQDGPELEGVRQAVQLAAGVHVGLRKLRELLVRRGLEGQLAQLELQEVAFPDVLFEQIACIDALPPQLPIRIVQVDDIGNQAHLLAEVAMY